MKSQLIVWSVLLILPVIPVGILYLVFQEMNYFELRDTARGIVAFGPIAAYVALVLIGYNVYARVSKLSSTQHPAFSKLKGEWKVTSISSNDRKLEGSSIIKVDGIQLALAGEFIDNKEDGSRSAINWNTEMTKLKGNEFILFYTITEIKDGNVLELSGICTLQFGKDPIKKMAGVWQVVGKDKMLGTITFTRG